MRIAVGSIMQETNTFSPVPGTLDSFRRVFYACGDAVTEQLGDSSTEVTGFYDVLLTAGHDVVPTVAAMAVSGGRLTRPTYELLRAQLISRLVGQGRLDGLLLALHGAMCVEGDDDGDGSLLADVRAVVGNDLPVFVTHDLHANLTKRRASLCDGIVGYHTAPHVDHRETGRRAARLLLRTLEAWYEEDGSAKNAGKVLYLHPNTVRYRIRRIEDLTGHDLNRPKCVAEVYLALQAVRLGL